VAHQVLLYQTLINKELQLLHTKIKDGNLGHGLLDKGARVIVLNAI